METAGKEDFESDTEKKGLGTPATRAGIIEKLVKSGFAERKGRSLIPTKDGMELVKVLPEAVTSPAMTAEWENALLQIERGNASGEDFLNGIEKFTRDIVNEYRSTVPSTAFEGNKEVIGVCPRCGSEVVCGRGRYYCSNKDCGFCMWEDNKFFSSKRKKLTKSTVQQKDWDGRFSRDNKAWAKEISVCPENCTRFMVDRSHPGLTNIFVNAAREEFREAEKTAEKPSIREQLKTIAKELEPKKPKTKVPDMELDI